MAKTLQLKSKTTKNPEDEYFSDSDLMTLIAIIINEKPQYLIIDNIQLKTASICIKIN
jgi:hypothetical protein